MMNETLSIPEIADLPRVAETTVYSMAQLGGWRAFKVRGQSRIRRADLDVRINAQRAAARAPRWK